MIIRNTFSSFAAKRLLATKALRHEVKKSIAFSFVPLSLGGYIYFFVKKSLVAF
jgi:hypothetical protein